MKKTVFYRIEEENQKSFHEIDFVYENTNDIDQILINGESFLVKKIIDEFTGNTSAHIRHMFLTTTSQKQIL